MALLKLWSEYAPALNTAGLVGLAGIALALMRQIHTAKMENRRVTIDENKELREGLTEELEALRTDTRELRAEVSALRRENIDLRDEYRKSEASRRDMALQISALKEQNAELIGEVRRLYTFIDGIRREEQQRGSSASAVLLRAYPPDLVPDDIKHIIADGQTALPSARRRPRTKRAKV